MTDLDLADVIARRVPLVHTADAKRLPLYDVERIQNLSTSFSLDISAEDRQGGEKTVKSQKVLQIRESLYFYAGRCSDRGTLLLVYKPESEVTHTGQATRFDSGGLVWGYIHSALCPCACHHDLEADWQNARQRCCEACRPWVTCVEWNQAQNTPQCNRELSHLMNLFRNSTIDLVQWRTEFAEFLRTAYPDPSLYWFQSPSSGLEDIYGHPRNDWPSYAWEVRFHEPHALEEHLWIWDAKYNERRVIEKNIEKRATLGDAQDRKRLKAFLTKRMTREQKEEVYKSFASSETSCEELHHSEIMEHWIRINVVA